MIDMDQFRMLNTNRTLIIGLAGKKHCGKNTLADLLQKKAEAIHLKVVQFAFGDPLKDEVCSTYGIPKEYTTTQNGKMQKVRFHMDIQDPRYPHGSDVATTEKDGEYTCITTVRTLLQWYGTEYRRKQDEDYWIKKAKEFIIELAYNYDVIILTDVRFPNEFNLINSYPRHYQCRLHPYPGYEFPIDIHPSEIALDNCHSFDNEWYPKFGVFHLKLIANRIYKEVIRPFSIELMGEQETLAKVTEV